MIGWMILPFAGGTDPCDPSRISMSGYWRDPRHPAKFAVTQKGLRFSVVGKPHLPRLFRVREGNDDVRA